MSEERYDVEKPLAEQRAQADRFLRDLSEVANGDYIGMWFAPPGMENMHWFRAGCRYSDGSMPPAVARLYHKHKAMGAQDGPAGMRPPLGFESDGRLGVYLWYHPQVWANIQEAKRLVQKRTSAAEVMQREVGSGVELTVTKGYDKPRRGNR